MFKEGILVTGGRGFIGSETKRKLQEKGWAPRFFEGDICEVADWQDNLEDGDTVFLIAGIRTETEADVVTNAGGTENLFLAASTSNKLLKGVVMVSSQAVYMGNKPPFREDMEPEPTTIYGKSKLVAEKIAGRWCDKLSVPLVILRSSTVLGAGVREQSNMSGPLVAWVKAAAVDKPIKVFQDGNQSRDYSHVSDVARAIVLARDLPEGIYNVGGGKRIRLIDLAKWIREATKSRSEIVILGGEPSEKDPKEMFSDTAKIEKYSWKARKTAREAVEEYTAKFSTLA